jgi:hypothetical protein
MSFSSKLITKDPFQHLSLPALRFLVRDLTLRLAARRGGTFDVVPHERSSEPKPLKLREFELMSFSSKLITKEQCDVPRCTERHGRALLGTARTA